MYALKNSCFYISKICQYMDTLCVVRIDLSYKSVCLFVLLEQGY